MAGESYYPSTKQGENDRGLGWGLGFKNFYCLIFTLAICIDIAYYICFFSLYLTIKRMVFVLCHFASIANH